MRVLYHAVNGTGLGHLTRVSTIAGAVQALDREVSQAIVTNASYVAGAQSLSIPLFGIPDHDTNPYSALDRRLTRLPQRMVDSVLQHIIDEFDPTTLVLDTHFAPRVVEEAAAAGRQLVLVLRRTSRAHLGRLLESGLLDVFRLVLIPHERSSYQAGLPPELADRLDALPSLSYVEPVVRPTDETARAELVRRLAISRDRALIVVSSGAGGYPAAARKLTLNVLAAATTLPFDNQVVVVGGPYAEDADMPAGCTYLPVEPYLQELFAVSDLVVAHGGYNTAHEIAQVGARAVFVAAVRANEDQSVNVRWLVERGQAACLSNRTSTGMMAASMVEQLKQPRPAPIHFNGRWQAAERILATSPQSARVVLGHLQAPAGWSQAHRGDLASILERARASAKADAGGAVLVSYADLVLDQVCLVHPSQIQWFVDLGSGPTEALVSRVIALRRRIERVRPVFVATVAENPVRLVTAVGDSGGSGLVLKVRRPRLGPLPFWIPSTFAFSRRHYPALILDFTDADRPVLRV